MARYLILILAIILAPAQAHDVSRSDYIDLQKQVTRIKRYDLGEIEKLLKQANDVMGQMMKLHETAGKAMEQNRLSIEIMEKEIQSLRETIDNPASPEYAL